MLCFNPCCIGLGIQTRWQKPWTSLLCDVSILVVLDWVFKQKDYGYFRKSLKKFQSLLYWIGYSNELQEICVERNTLFQSLLYWIGYSNKSNMRN